MKLENISRQISEWFDGKGPHSDIVISSRIRLARNLAGYEFLPRLTPERQEEILEKLKSAILSVDVGHEVFFIDVNRMFPILGIIDIIFAINYDIRFKIFIDGINF